MGPAEPGGDLTLVPGGSLAFPTPLTAHIIASEESPEIMRVFLSHSSKQKPLIREIKAYLPSFLVSWIDEEKLLFGDDVTSSIETTIKTDTDYVLLFIDDHAVRSPWVRREVEWALSAEKEHDRIILLPIVIETPNLESLGVVQIRERKYLHLQDLQEHSVRSFARSLSDSLFALVCRDMHRLHHPNARPALAKIAEAEAILRAQAAVIQKVVFPHRNTNPISKEKLLEIVNAHSEPLFADHEFDMVLTTIAQRNLIPGLRYDGFALFLVEEHAKWKSDVHRERKERIGRKTAALIQNGMKVLFDAGSTVEEVVRLLCKKIETRALTNLTAVTTSVNIADMISDCCVKMGFDDEFSAVALLIPSGRIRPNTQAIVPCGNREPRDLVAFAERLEGFDLGIVGVNGIDVEEGFTTHDNAERLNKADIMAVSRKCVIVGDSSKIGIVLEYRFAAFDNEVTLVVDEDTTNESFQLLMRRHHERVLVA